MRASERPVIKSATFTVLPASCRYTNITRLRLHFTMRGVPPVCRCATLCRGTGGQHARHHQVADSAGISGLTRVGNEKRLSLLCESIRVSHQIDLRFSQGAARLGQHASGGEMRVYGGCHTIHRCPRFIFHL